jgi:hypothetical protein
MSKHNKHHVKVHKWGSNGILETVLHEFESLAAALDFTHNQHRQHTRAVYDTPVEQVIKVYTPEGELVHSTDGSHESYA